MASVNKVILIGNLGADPEIRYFPSGGAVTSIRIATTETWNDKQSGEKRERTEWHRIEFFGRLAEIVKEYLKKGSPVYVEGRIQTDKWQDKDGNDRYTTKIIAREMQMLSSRGSSGDGDGGFNQSAPPASKASSGGGGNAPASPPADDFDDDIPF